MIRVKLIDDTSAVIVADGAISVHNFATGADREIANFPEAFDVWITSPERIWIARDEQPTLLIDGEGKTVAEFAAGMYPIAARGGCSLITRWNVQETLLVDNNSGRTITTFVLDPEVFHGADTCTTLVIWLERRAGDRRPRRGPRLRGLRRRPFRERSGGDRGR